MEEGDKNHTGNGSVDITIHEWLHTLYEEEVNGKRIPCPDDEQRYAYDGKYLTEKSGEQHGWVNWYRALLTGKYEPKARFAWPATCPTQEIGRTDTHVAQSATTALPR